MRIYLAVTLIVAFAVGGLQAQQAGHSKAPADRWKIVLDEIKSEDIPGQPQKFLVRGRVVKGKDCPGFPVRGVDVLIYTKDIEGGNLQLQKDGDIPRLKNLVFDETLRESEVRIPIWLGSKEDHKHSYEVYAFLICGATRPKLQAIAAATHDKYIKASEIWETLEHQNLRAEPLASTPSREARRRD